MVPHLFNAFTCRFEFPAMMNDEIVPSEFLRNSYVWGAGAIGTRDLAFIIDGHCTRIKHDRQIRSHTRQLASGIQSIHYGHREIEKDQMRVEERGLVNCLATVAGFLSSTQSGTLSSTNLTQFSTGALSSTIRMRFGII